MWILRKIIHPMVIDAMEFLINKLAMTKKQMKNSSTL